MRIQIITIKKNTMNTKILLLLTVIGVFFVVACGTSENSNRETVRYGTTVEIDNPDISLDRYISRLSGVSVHGSGSNATIEVRGADSIELDSRPLFVINGVRVGRDFSQIYNMVNMSNVESIQMMRPSRATQFYGTDGGFGAIIINMKR